MVQQSAYVALCRLLCRGIPDHDPSMLVRGHFEEWTSRKVDPAGSSMWARQARARGACRSTARTWPTPRHQHRHLEEDDDMAFIVINP